MTKFIGYANYGVLAHEKQIIFTADQPHSQAAASEEVKIKLPEWFSCLRSADQGLIITVPNGWKYTADEILQSRNDKPVLVWYDGDKECTVECKYTEI